MCLMQWTVKSCKMTNIESILSENFSESISTFKETSFDDTNNEYLCTDTTQKVYNLDKLKDDNCLKPHISSPDALLIDVNRVYLVEFKNQEINVVSSKKVKNKLRGGQLMLKKIFSNYKLDIKKYKFVYCVAYNDSKYEEYQQKTRRGITRNKIRFDLLQFEDKFFNEIYTNDVRYFSKEFKKKHRKELVCL